MLGISCSAAAMLSMAAIAICGCGGSTKSSSQTAASVQSATSGQTSTTAQGAPLPRTVLIARSNAICRRVNTQLNSVTPSTPQQLIELLPRFVALERGALTELEKLVPPPSLAAGWKQVLASMETLADNTAKLAAAAKSNPRVYPKTEHAVVTSNYRTRKPMLAAATRAGFSECGQVL